ncbi:MAG: response regulator [Xenococcaceae cyanobacterium MO_188.B29]|nr:response regulator [Xenococcaceae cyanobacterium MO_188.B29]
MTAKSVPEDLTVKEFSASKQAKLFDSLQQSRLSGQLVFTSPHQQDQWCFYLYLGQIVYATGGVHPFRRWQRNVRVHLPQISFDLNKEISAGTVDKNNSLWEYQQIFDWVKQEKITEKQASKIVNSVVEEVLFDITQRIEVICKIYQGQWFEPQFESIDPQKLVQKNQRLWQTWQKAKIADRFPCMAPTILQDKQLKQNTSEHTYQNLCKLLNGSKTIRELAIELKTSALQLTRSFLPYFQSGVLGLTEVPDLIELSSEGKIATSQNKSQPLVACVDDSEMVCFTIEQILSISGYRFLAINDPLRAISTLLEHKPDFIFLDIVMPHISGYELCSKLRQHPSFAQTPIVFLTSNNGMVDRLRAKMVGSSDFINKTIDPDKLLNLISKHLNI